MDKKLEVYQTTTDDGKKTYLIYRYWDNHNNNFEYQIYKLESNTKKVIREFGISENKLGRKSKLTTREMCDKLIEKINN
jgi:hypothetical protein